MAGRFSIEAVFRAIDRMTAPIAKIQSRMERFTKAAEKGIKDLDKASDRWFSGLSKASTAVAAATAATAAALALAAKPGMEFEQAMADLGASYLKTRKEIEPLEKAALKLGASTQFSATEVAGAMEEMSKAGYEEMDVLAGIEGMTYAAAAAGEELVPTAKNVSAAMKSMGRDVSLTTRSADVLAMASVRTASSIASLAESLSKVGPVAKQFNIPFEDTVAMVAMLQDAGIDASEAGSAVATMLSMMASPTDAVRAKMKKLGISFKDASGNMLAPTEVLGQLVKMSDKAGGNMEQVAFFTDLLGMRGQKAALNLKSMFADGKYAKLMEELGVKADGTAKRMSDLRMDTMTGDLDVFIENVKSLGIELYSVQSGGLRGIVQGMTEWLGANSALITSGITGFFDTISKNFETIVTWGRRIATIVAVISAAAAAVKLWAGAVWLLNAALAANPISLIAIAVVGAIALVLAFWPEISAFFTSMWDGMVRIASGIASAIGTAVQAVWAPIASFLLGVFEFFIGGWVLLLSALYTPVRPIFDGIAEIVGEAVGWMMDHWEPIKAFFGAIWDGIVWTATTSFDLLVSAITGYVDMIKAIWTPIYDFYAALFQGIADLWLTIFGPVWEGIGWAVDAVREVGAVTLGTSDRETSRDSSEPQVVSPQERVAQSISETNTTNSSELTIRDETGRGVMTRKPKGPGVGIKLRPSGAF